MSTSDEKELIDASQAGDTIRISRLLSKIPAIDINCRDEEHGTTPLYVVSAAGSSDAVQKLLGAANVDATIPDKNGLQPIHAASHLGHTDVIALLLSHGVDINVRQNPEGQTPITLAASAGELDTVKWLIDKGADFDVTLIDESTLLHESALASQGHVTSHLIELGLDQDTRSTSGLTPLAFAAWHDKVSPLTVLLHAGANPELSDVDGYTPLHASAQDGHLECLSALIPVSDINKQNNNGNTALMLAAKFGHSNCIEALLGAKCDATFVTTAGYTAMNGQAKCLSMLHAKCDTNLANVDGFTPLHSAAEKGRPECLSLLIPVSDINKQDKHGLTPLHWAAQEGHTECMSLLIPVSDINKQAAGLDGYTPLICAVVYGTAACAELLLAAGADPEIENIHGFTALEYAASKGKLESVQVLLNYGAVIRSTNARSPSKLAEDSGHTEIARLLVTFEAEHDTKADILGLPTSPKITALVDQSITVGQEVLLIVHVDGNPEPDVNWYLAGVKIVSSSNYLMTKVGPRHSLTLKDTRSIPNNGMVVSVVARNMLDETWSKAEITVKEAGVGPEVASFKPMKTAEGNDVIFETTVRGIPTPDVRWSHNGNNITLNPKYLVEVFSKRHILKIRQAEPRDSGTISLSAVNASGTKLETAELTVIGRNVGPEVDSLQSMKSSEGSDVTFETTVRGIPTPDVKWRHSGNDITSSSKYSVEVFSERHKLTIRQVEPSDSGTICLSAVNASGTKLETAELTVIGKLSITTKAAKPKWGGRGLLSRIAKLISKSSDITEHPDVRNVKSQQETLHVSDICKRFLEDQNLSVDYFDHHFDVCFCVRCHTKKGDELMYTRGVPPKKYGLPIGWCKFGLATKPQAKAKDVFTKWHMAFHGTRVECLDKIIDTGDFLMPGDVTPGGERLKIPTNHWDPTNPHMLPPEGHNVTKFFFSPSIKYSGCDVYAPKQRWMDPATNLAHEVRVAFQVRIQPGTYDVGKQTIGAKGTIDPLFSNNQLEWSTARRGVTILVGLLIKIDDVVGDSASEMIRGLKLTDTPSSQSGRDSSYHAFLEFQHIYKSRDGKPIVLNSGDKCLVLGERKDICTIVHPAVNEQFKVPNHYVKKL